MVGQRDGNADIRDSKDTDQKKCAPHVYHQCQADRPPWLSSRDAGARQCRSPVEFLIASPARVRVHQYVTWSRKTWDSTTYLQQLRGSGVLNKAATLSLESGCRFLHVTTLNGKSRPVPYALITVTVYLVNVDKAAEEGAEGTLLRAYLQCALDGRRVGTGRSNKKRSCPNDVQLMLSATARFTTGKTRNLRAWLLNVRAPEITCFQRIPIAPLTLRSGSRPGSSISSKATLLSCHVLSLSVKFPVASDSTQGTPFFPS